MVVSRANKHHGDERIGLAEAFGQRPEIGAGGAIAGVAAG